jgi:hypothetical protein
MADPYARRRLVLVAALAATTVGLVALLAGADSDGSAALTTTTTTIRRTTPSTLDVAAIASSDRFAVAPGTGTAVGQGERWTYTVEVEVGIPIDPAGLAAVVDTVLADPRGWTAGGDVQLQRVGPGTEPSFHIRLATPATTDAHCAPLDTHGELSCRNGADVMLNLRRWVHGAAPSEMGLAEYHQYMVSHEVGHALGHDHAECPGPGQPAPVMLQQTLGLGGCRPNPWPFP